MGKKLITLQNKFLGDRSKSLNSLGRVVETDKLLNSDSSKFTVVVKPSFDSIKKFQQKNKELQELTARIGKCVAFPNYEFSKLQNKNTLSAGKYISVLRELLNDEEFQESNIWVDFVENQILELENSPGSTINDPDQMDQAKKESAVRKSAQEMRSKGGAATNKIYRDDEKRIIEEAEKLIKTPHDNRPYDRYRTATLAEVILNSLSGLHVTKRKAAEYLKKAVDRQDLPGFLTKGRPKNW